MGEGIAIRSQEQGHQQKLKPRRFMPSGMSCHREHVISARGAAGSREKGRDILGFSPPIFLWCFSLVETMGSQRTGDPGEGSSQSRAGEGYKVHLRPDGQLASSGVRVVGSTEDRVGQSMPSGGAHCV